MVALIVGLIFLVFGVIAVLPSLLGWGPEVILFIKGMAPCLAFFLGIIAVFIGIADIKDRNEAKREEAEALKAQEDKKE
jgi:uncharacterized membrane protein